MRRINVENTGGKNVGNTRVTRRQKLCQGNKRKEKKIKMKWK